VPETAASVRKSEVATAAPAPVLAAAPAPARETAKERRAREARERETRAREARPTPPPVVVTGIVRLAVSPWGQVEVDGVASGAAPPLTELKLAEGPHRIVVRNGDFAPFVAMIEVVGGQTTSLRHKFGGSGS
jgi:serine/threonine-protein kinase